MRTLKKKKKCRIRSDARRTAIPSNVVVCIRMSANDVRVASSDRKNDSPSFVISAIGWCNYHFEICAKGKF